MSDILSYFPPPFSPRPQQKEAIERIQAAFDAGKRVVGLELPTGGGKSFIAQTFGRAVRELGGKTFVLTAQKILQDQYTRDFPEPEMLTIKGRNAYPCQHRKGLSVGANCADAPCTREGRSIIEDCISNHFYRPKDFGKLIPGPRDTICPYWQQILKATRAPIVLFNFSSFLFQQRSGRFKNCNLMIIDEAHNIESNLMGYVELRMWESDLDCVNMSLREGLSSADGVLAWIKENTLLSKIDEEVLRLGLTEEKDILDFSLKKSVQLQQKEDLEKLAHKLELFMANFEKTTWVVEVKKEYRYKVLEKVLICRPVYAKDFANDLLFNKATRVLASSATILDRDVWSKNLGLKADEVEFIQLGSDFPVAHRPIRKEYMGSMSYDKKDETIPKLVSWIKETLLPRHEGERGIIHAHSFDLAKKIMAGVGSPRLLLHESGQNKAEILERHKARADSVIVAPAFHEGIDLKDDLSRFQVLCKIPYPSTQDLVISTRMREDEGWYGWLTALKLVQSYGRSVRSKDDYAVTYITDSGFNSFMRRSGKYLPQWFREAIEKPKIVVKAPSMPKRKT